MTTQPCDLKARWWAWHKANPHVWALFERFTMEAHRRGASRLSGWLIVNRIRWETTIVTRPAQGPGGEGSDGDFKISNDFVALYVRLFQHRHPGLAHLFVTKPAKRLGERRAQPVASTTHTHGEAA